MHRSCLFLVSHFKSNMGMHLLESHDHGAAVIGGDWHWVLSTGHKNYEMVEMQRHVCMMAGELRCIAAVVPPYLVMGPMLCSCFLFSVVDTSSGDHRAALQYLVLCFIVV